MDIISHGLWGGVAFGRKNKKDYWLSFFFGMAPDLFSFGIYTVATVFGLGNSVQAQRFGQHDMSAIPQYVHTLYNYTHSLVIFLLVFSLVWLIRRRPLWVMGAWGLHILVDIPSHADIFFPTPFLWPLSDFHVNGIGWGNPIIFIPNIILLLIAYVVWFIARRKMLKNNNSKYLDVK